MMLEQLNRVKPQPIHPALAELLLGITDLQNGTIYLTFEPVEVLGLITFL